MVGVNPPASCQHGRLTAGLVLSLLMNVLVLCLAVYASQVIVEMKHDIRLLQAEKHSDERDIQIPIKREILSGPEDRPNVRAQQQDKTGASGTGATAFTPLGLVKEMINETVNKEWKALSSRLPSYGGVTFTRWGSKGCPSKSKMIYTGQMAASNSKANGGGANPLCLPTDPQYDANAPYKAFYSTLTAVQLEVVRHNGIFPSYTPRTPVACAVCEAEQRITKLMIPAVVSCPDSSWQLEFKGYLMSEASVHWDGSAIVGSHFRTTYVCVDHEAESYSSTVYPNDHGAELHFNRAQCSGDGALGSCPPYQTNKALSCVVCTK